MTHSPVSGLNRRSVVLVTGMSGTGKSSALAELARRGHRVVDTDDPGWIVESRTPSGNEPLLRGGADHEIVTTEPIRDVAEELERVAGGAQSADAT